MPGYQRRNLQPRLEKPERENQYPEDTVRRTVVRRFDVAVGRCRACGRRVQGRHPLQTSNALGAARVPLGPEALARLAAKAEPTYHELIQTARASLVNGVDETGWRVGGRLPWMWVAVSAQVTGSGATATARCCWRPWWTGGGFPAPAIGPPTGFCWVKPKDAVAWIAPIKPMAQLAS